MVKHTLALCFALALGVVPATAAAQARDAALGAGIRVRVTSRGAGLAKRIGRVLSTSDDSVTVEVEALRTDGPTGAAAPPPPRQYVVHRSDVEVSIGRHTNGKRGTLRGALAGLVIGVVGGYVEGRTQSCNDDTKLCIPPPLFSIVRGVQGVVLGGAVGGIVGRQIRTERWLPALTQ